MSDIDTNGKRLNLFPMKKKKKKVSSNRAFDMMNTVADKSNVDINNMENIDKSTKGIHNALMAAGMTPAYGNVADLADATLYALEGEFGDAAWSAAAAIPIIGQMVAGKKALKVAKKAGDEMVTVYRGVPAWYKGKMVKDGKFIGGGGSGKNSFWTTNSKNQAKYYADRASRVRKEYLNLELPFLKGEKSRPTILEFEVPSSWAKNNIKNTPLKQGNALTYIFEEGIPKEFLKKVHK